MKNQETRLTELENKLRPKPKDEIVVWIVDDQTGEHTRSENGAVVETLTPAEWDQYSRQPGRKIIVVDYIQEPIKDQ